MIGVEGKAIGLTFLKIPHALNYEVCAAQKNAKPLGYLSSVVLGYPSWLKSANGIMRLKLHFALQPGSGEVPVVFCRSRGEREHVCDFAVG